MPETKCFHCLRSVEIPDHLIESARTTDRRPLCTSCFSFYYKQIPKSALPAGVKIVPAATTQPTDEEGNWLWHE